MAVLIELYDQFLAIGLTFAASNTEYLWRKR